MRRTTLSALPLALLCTLAFASSAAAHGLDARALPTLREYFVLGVEHILEGYDHLLFLAGLAVAARRVREMLWTISAFTLAHSVTLALGMFGLVTPNAAVIEVIIALSIAYVGYENLRLAQAQAQAPKSRVWIVLGFGLAHGFGFASAIHDVGLPPDRELLALALFNLGVESGQLLVLAPFVLALRYLRRAASVERIAVRAINVAIIVAGLSWTLQRTLTVESPTPAVLAASGVASDAASDFASMLARKPAPSAAPFDRAKVLPEARSLCAAFQTLPRVRRAECTNTKPGITLAAACERNLDRSLRSTALTLDAARAERCVEALTQRYEDCSFAAQRVLPAQAECTDLVRGARPEAAACTSSLECESGLHCHGAGPLDTGVCGKPLPAGASCERAADPLASYFPNDKVAHPECEGQCVRGHCADLTLTARREGSGS